MDQYITVLTFENTRRKSHVGTLEDALGWVGGAVNSSSRGRLAEMTVNLLPAQTELRAVRVMLSRQLESPRVAAVNAECDAARREGREISDWCARTIMSWHTASDNAAMFVQSGMVISETLWQSVFLVPHGDCLYNKLSEREKREADMLGTYLVHAGVRGPQPGWSDR